MPRRPSRHEGADVDAHTKAPVALTVRKSLMVEDAKTMSRSVAEQARKLSNNLEEQVLEELENVPTSCQLRGEWAISDEDLVELKKRTIKCNPTKRSTGSAHWSYLPPSQRVYFHAGEAAGHPHQLPDRCLHKWRFASGPPQNCSGLQPILALLRHPGSGPRCDGHCRGCSRCRREYRKYRSPPSGTNRSFASLGSLPSHTQAGSSRPVGVGHGQA